MENHNNPSSIDSDVDKPDSDVDKPDSDVYKSDSESESETSEATIVSVQYMLPRRNNEAFRSSTIRNPMDRMAATNKPVRLKHGTTARDIIVPFNRNTTTSSNNSKAQRETTSPLKIGTARRETTTPLNSDTASREISSLLKINEAWRIATTPLNGDTALREITSLLKINETWRITTTPLNSDTASRETTTPLNSDTASRETTTQLKIGTAQRETTSQVYKVPVEDWFKASSIYMTPRWLIPRSSRSSRCFTERLEKFVPPELPSNAQTFAPPYRAPDSPPPYRPPVRALPSTSQTFMIRNTAQGPQSFTTSLTFTAIPPYRGPSYSPSHRPPYCASLNSPQTSMIRNTFESPRSPIRFQLPVIPPYRPPSPPSPPPAYRPSYFGSSYGFQPYTMHNTSQMPTSSTRSQSFIESRGSIPTRSPPPYHLAVPYFPTSSVPISTTFGPTSVIYTFQSAMSTHTFQSSTSTHTTQSSTSNHSPQSSTSTNAPQSYTSNHTSQSSASTNNIRPSTARYFRNLTGDNNASASYSSYTFPQSVYYGMPTEEGSHHMIVSPASTSTSYSLSKYNLYDKSLQPMEMGPASRISKENLWSMLAISVQNALPPLSKVHLENSVWSSTATCEDDNGLPSLVPLRLSTCATRVANAFRPEDQQTNGKLWKLIHSCIDNLARTVEKNISYKLYKAYLYFNKMEIVEISPCGDIKCVFPAFKFEELESMPTKNKFHLVNMYHQYMKINKLFASEYDYNSVPQNRIDIEDKEVVIWLNWHKMNDYFWFFKSLSLLELENLNSINIKNFIMRSKRNMTISLEDQLKICCMVKKLKELPVTLMAILLVAKNLI